jgi:hypothetical protein
MATKASTQDATQQTIDRIRVTDAQATFMQEIGQLYASSAREVMRQ